MIIIKHAADSLRRNNVVFSRIVDRWQMTFDSTNPDLRQRGNLLQSIHIPDDRGGDQVQLEQQFVYDPFYNQPCLRMDARAYAANFTPQNGGVVSPIRYATQYIFDYQEGPDNDIHKQRLADKFGLTLQQVKDIIDFNESQIEQALGLAAGSVTILGQGDLNGDGRTDQINGNHVLLIQPNVTLISGSHQAIEEGDTTQEIKTAFAYDDNGLLLYTMDPVGNVSDYQYFPATDPNGDGNTNDVTELRSGNGYLQSSIEDNRELPAVTQRLATADSIPFASLTTQYQRDPVGNLTEFTDPRGNTWTNIYNELNQIIRVIEPAPYSYNTDTIYDANNNIVQTIKENKIPDLIDFKPQFDINNNVILANGTPNTFVQNYDYDILNKLLTSDIDATDSIPNRLVTIYQYDAVISHFTP